MSDNIANKDECHKVRQGVLQGKMGGGRATLLVAAGTRHPPLPLSGCSDAAEDPLQQQQQLRPDPSLDGVAHHLQSMCPRSASPSPAEL